LHWQRASSADQIEFLHEPPSLVHPDAPVVLTCADPDLPSGRWLVFQAEFDRAGLVEVLVEVRFADGKRMVLRPVLTGRNCFYASFRPTRTIASVTLRVSGSGHRLKPKSLRFAPVNAAKQIVPLVRRAAYLVRHHPSRLPSSASWFLNRMFASEGVHLPPQQPSISEEGRYQRWIDLLDEHPERDRALHVARMEGMSRKPVISALAAVDDASRLRAVLSDLQSQIYTSWQLVAVCGDGVDPEVVSKAEDDQRVRIIRSGAPDRAARLNAALSAADGEIVLAPSEDGRLRPHALLECALTFTAWPRIAMLYADEDVCAPDGRRSAPRFKPAWSPHSAVVMDIMGDPTFYAAKAVRQAGGWREGFAGAEDHDLKLRISENAGASAVMHLAKILFSRTLDEAAEPTGGVVARIADDHLQRSGIPAKVRMDPRSPVPRVVAAWPQKELVSIIIPTRDRADILRPCMASILDRTRYPEFEVIIVDNGSQEPRTHALFEELGRDGRVRILSRPDPFNFSALNNAAAREARGSLLALVNNDIEVMSPDWLDEMVGYALEPRVGCVGAKLYYPNGTLQHASVVVGLSGGAGHIDKHSAGAARGYLDRLVTVRNVSAVTAACLAVRKDVYEKVGGLDEALFKVAFNDVDFCLKVAAAGYVNVWTPFAELIHHESISRGDDLRDRAKARRFAGELSALQERWGQRLYFDPYFSPHLDWQAETGGIRIV
jgi:GT2 family glycosyltransferase